MFWLLLATIIGGLIGGWEGAFAGFVSMCLFQIFIFLCRLLAAVSSSKDSNNS